MSIDVKQTISDSLNAVLTQRKTQLSIAQDQLASLRQQKTALDAAVIDAVNAAQDIAADIAKLNAAITNL